MLPDELWLDIFQLATHVQGIFDVQQDPFAYPGLSSPDQIQTDIHATYCTKRRIALVCRTWNELATPLLYQAILIPRLASFSRLRATLDPHQPSAWSKAAHTKRLDFRFREEGTIDGTAFQEVVSMFRNLQIFVIRNQYVFVDNTDRPSLLRALTSIAPPSLSFIDMQPKKIDIYEPDYDVRTSFDLSKCCLRTLAVSVSNLTTMWDVSIDIRDVCRLAIPWQVFISLLAHRPLPSLQHLAIRGRPNFGRGLTLDKFGGQLLSLEIPDDIGPYPSFGFNDIGQPIQAVMQMIEKHCPNLKHLTLAVTDDQRFTDAGPGTALPLMDIISLPPVEKLGIELSKKTRLSKTRWRDVLEKIQALCAVTPSITVVRLTGHPTKAELAARHAGTLEVIRIKAQALKERGVRLEDRLGLLLT